jgi:hypothetical protein
MSLRSGIYYLFFMIDPLASGSAPSPQSLQLEERRTLNSQYSTILHTMNNQRLVPADTHLGHDRDLGDFISHRAQRARREKTKTLW